MVVMGERTEPKSIGIEEIQALNEEVRLEILKKLNEKPSYPAEIAGSLDIPKQKAYYHFNILEKHGMIEKHHQEDRSGGIATFYMPSSISYLIDISKGEQEGTTGFEDSFTDFMKPMINSGELQGSIVVGSPDEHGPDQVRARDGHLACEIGLKIGSHVENTDFSVALDTEIFNSESFDQNLLMVGGVLTNTVTRKFNSEFPVGFEGESFPYRALETSENRYTNAKIGVVAKTRNPLSEENRLFLVAGIQGDGTEAAVLAFKDLENIIEEGDRYVIIRGKDMNGDGRIDDYEVMEKDG